MRPVRALFALATLALLPAVGACNLEISNQAEAKSEWKKDYRSEEHTSEPPVTATSRMPSSA